MVLYLDRLITREIDGYESIWDSNILPDNRPSAQVIADSIQNFIGHSHLLLHVEYPDGVNVPVTMPISANPGSLTQDYSVFFQLHPSVNRGAIVTLLTDYVNRVINRNNSPEGNRELIDTLAENIALQGGIDSQLFLLKFKPVGTVLGRGTGFEISVKELMMLETLDGILQYKKTGLNLCLHHSFMVLRYLTSVMADNDTANPSTPSLPPLRTPLTSPTRSSGGGSPTRIPETTPTRTRLTFDADGETKSSPVNTATGGPSHVEQSMDGVFGFFNNVAEFLHIPGPRIPLIGDSARIGAGGGSTPPPGTSSTGPAGSSSTPIPSTSGLISTTPPAINTFQVGQAQDASTVLGAAGLNGFPVGSINMKSAIELDPKKMLDTIEMQKRIFSQVIDTTNKLPLATLESKNTDDKDVLIREANKIVRQYGREIGLYTLPYTALHPLGMVKEQYNFVLRKANEWLKLISGSQTADGKQLSALHDNYTKAQQIIDEALNLNSIMKAKAVGVTEAQNENTRLAGLAIQAAGQYALGGNRDLGLAFATSVPPLPFFQVGRYAGDKKRPMEKLVEDEVYLPSLYGPTMGDCILRITKLPRRDPIPFNDHPSFEYV